MVDAYIRRVENDLATTNRHVMDGRWTILDFIENWCHGMPCPNLATGPRPDWVHAVGMVRSSLERHLAVTGGAPSTAQRWMPPDAVTVALAGEHPPRDVLRPYLSQTGYLNNEGEQAFKTATIAVGSLFGQAMTLLLPLSDPKTWADPDTVDRLRLAQNLYASANSHFRNLARADDEVRRQFTNEVRGFYQSRVVGGQTLEGINAAHEWRVAVTDIFLGVDDKAYRKYFAVIRHHFLPNEAAASDRVMSVPSLRRALSERLGGRDVLTAEARNEAIRQGANMRAAADAFAGMLNTFAGVSGAHGGVIRTYLEQAPQGQGALQRGISVQFGSGGRPHADTIAIHKRRREVARLALTHLSFPTERTELSWPTSQPETGLGRASSAQGPSA